uniref:Plac8 onzin related protein 1 n=1 Tax=Esox lucius TaxID=8010 RepID=A0A3P8YTA4_ESOLU
MVVVQQSTIVTRGQRSQGWSTGLCNCCSDICTCCSATWCFPVLQCQTAAQFGWCMCLPMLDPCTCCAISCCLRSSMRERYGIRGSLCADVGCVLCCYTLTWCQMAREVKRQAMSRPQTVTVVTQQVVVAP